MTAEREAVGGDRQRRPDSAGPDGRSAAEGGGVASGSLLRRVAGGVLGGVLLVRGFRRGRSLRGLLTALAGGWLLSRAVRGRGGGAKRETRETGPGRIDVGSVLASSRREPGASEDAAEVSRSVTVGVPAAELHDYWREAEDLSEIVGHFAEVEEREDGRFRWTVPGQWGTDVGWESRITVDRPGEVLRWETLPGADVPNEGTVRFRQAPGDRGTEVEMTVRFDPPGGRPGRALLSVLGVVPATVVSTSLRRFKSLAEAGEIPTLEGNPSGRGRGDLV